VRLTYQQPDSKFCVIPAQAAKFVIATQVHAGGKTKRPERAEQSFQQTVAALQASIFSIISTQGGVTRLRLSTLPWAYMLRPFRPF
jgi:hypothetical protein